jgi:hypothetical protein
MGELFIALFFVVGYMDDCVSLFNPILAIISLIEVAIMAL